MIRALALLAALAVASAATAQPAPAPVITVLKTFDATSAGQPVVMPAGPLRVTVSQTVIPRLGALPPHKHPFPRYVYVLAGQLRVTNLVTGQVSELKAGDMTIDPIDQWHEARAIDGAVTLITIDQAPPGAATTVRRDP
jgi:quercetin dioxygenase-like cupin family protein